jgi:hypothetical protein
MSLNMSVFTQITENYHRLQLTVVISRLVLFQHRAGLKVHKVVYSAFLQHFLELLVIYDHVSSIITNTEPIQCEQFKVISIREIPARTLKVNEVCMLSQTCHV